MEEKRHQFWNDKNVQKYMNENFDFHFGEIEIPKWVDFELFKTDTIKKMFDLLLETFENRVDDIENMEPEWYDIIGVPFGTIDTGVSAVWDYLNTAYQFPIPKEVIDSYEQIFGKLI